MPKHQVQITIICEFDDIASAEDYMKKANINIDKDLNEINKGSFEPKAWATYRILTKS